MSQTAIQPITLENLEMLEDRTGQRFELWQGTPVAMTGGSSAHNLIALGLHRVLDSQLILPCVAYAADMALKLQPNAYSDKAYPDGMVVCDPLPGAFQTAPILLAEVLSETSVKRDRGDKWRAYTQLDSLQVYLIISQTSVHIEVYRRQNNWEREDFLGLDAVIDLTTPCLNLPLKDIFAKAIGLGLLGQE